MPQITFMSVFKLKESIVNCAILLVNPFGGGIKGGVLVNCSTVVESAFFLFPQRDLRYDKSSFYLWFLPNGQAYKVREMGMLNMLGMYIHVLNICLFKRKLNFFSKSFDGIRFNLL